jgi:hypothetical protein
LTLSGLVLTSTLVPGGGGNSSITSGTSTHWGWGGHAKFAEGIRCDYLRRAFELF